MNYEESVAYMSGRLQLGVRLGRERFAELLARMGNPQDRFRAVHVAGTNGKGSTTTFVASVLQEAGYRVGSYLSPYVFDLRERVQIDGRMISEADFARWVTCLRPHIEAIEAETDLGPTTEFELKTAVAFCHFAEQQVDFAAVEVGIGGRLDATNVIPPPLAAVITHIGLDHRKLLGETHALIAGEKAGILKPGTICITAVPPGPALDVIRSRADEVGCPLVRVVPDGERVDGPAVRYSIGPDSSLNLEMPGGGVHGLRLALRGPFQAVNAATAAGAIDALRRQGVAIPDAALRRGLETASLPGRFQIVRDGSDGRPALVLDVAHNEDGARVLSEALDETFPGRRVHLVVGMSHNHEPDEFLGPFARRAQSVVATAPEFRPRSPEEVADAARRMGIPAGVVEPVARAIETALAEAQAADVVVVTGSFYTVGETPPHLRGRWA